MGMYVFRIAKGHAGGEPTVDCPIDMRSKEHEIRKKLDDIDIDIIPYDCNNYIDYLHRELWQCGKLRQGWGLEGLDLKIFEKEPTEWIENYILGAKKNWGEIITKDYCHVATGRYNILKLMTEAKKDDLVFIPKHSFDKHHDENYFTVCKIIGQYYFDLDYKYRDFGHVVIIKDLQSYRYSKNTLLPGDFIGYRKALGKIWDDHQLYQEKRFKDFLKNNYLISI